MRGFTIIELMITVLILGIIFSAGIPKLNQFYERHVALSTSQQFRKYLHMTRAYALENESSHTLCSLVNKKCHSDWNSSLSIFTDRNKNAVLDENEVVILTSDNLGLHGSWMKKKPQQAFVRFNESGHAFGSATTFLYCPYSKQNQYARQVIISFQGRIRTYPYLSTKGIPYASVHPLVCP